MLTCVIIIMIILIIFVTGIAIYYNTSYTNQKYTYYDGTYVKNRRNRRQELQDGFGNRNRRQELQDGFANRDVRAGDFDNRDFANRDFDNRDFDNGTSNRNNQIISALNDTPPMYSADSWALRAQINRNIEEAQGKSIAELYRKQYNGPLVEDGGSDLCSDALSCIGTGTTTSCSGIGEDTTCKVNKDLPKGINTYNHTGRKLSPEDIMQAEQELWAVHHFGDDNIDPHNDNLLGTGLPSSTKIPTGDYNSHVTNLVADARVLENQHKWATEMGPWSGTAFSPDDIDELMGNSLPFVGLRRPQAVAQGPDALFITAVGAVDFISNQRAGHLPI